MKLSPWRSLLLVIVLFAFGATTGAHVVLADDSTPHIVFLIGEDEYKSEEFLPPIAKYLEENYGFRTTLVFSDEPETMPGLDALQDADTAVMYMRFRTLPEEENQKVADYLDAGGNLVAIRTSTHGFRNWQDFAPTYLGTPWWQYHYGHLSTTQATIIPEQAEHPILSGVAPNFHSRSWLYFVQPLHEDAIPLMIGHSTGISNREGERTVNPVAWTWERLGGRMFYTSLGHPDDFYMIPFRRMLINAIFWSLDKPVPEHCQIRLGE